MVESVRPGEPVRARRRTAAWQEERRAPARQQVRGAAGARAAWGGRP
ncbi:hypothetical protein [Streptomyces xiaopingdaonensis]|nr:hypothetical protein [Streptomyces xiaopingdaonensis]